MTATPNAPRERIDDRNVDEFQLLLAKVVRKARKSTDPAMVSFAAQLDDFLRRKGRFNIFRAAALTPSPAGMAEVEAAVDALISACEDPRNSPRSVARTALLDLIRPLFRPAPDMAEVEAALTEYGEAEWACGALSDIDNSEEASKATGLHDALLNLIARHRSAPGTPAIPAGWKLVPVEPTWGVDAMSGAGAEKIPAVDGICGIAGSIAVEVYRAMLAAVPPTPTPDETGR